MDKRGFFFSLLALFLVIMFFFYFKNSLDLRHRDFEVETEKYRFLQYNDFFKDVKTKYVPLQIRMVTKAALINISRNATLNLTNHSANISQAVFEGRVDQIPVLNNNYTFYKAISIIHDNWLYMHEYNYTVLDYQIRQKDWQNLTISYVIRININASGYSFEDNINQSVSISTLGINTSLGLIAPGWKKNLTEPCTLKRLGSNFNCSIPGAGVDYPGTSPS